MQKILLTLFLISCSAILFVPMVAQAAACPQCQTITAICDCGTTLNVAIGAGFCYPSTVYPSITACQAAMGGGAGGVTGPITQCTIDQPGALLAGCTNPCVFEGNARCGVCCLLQTLYNVTSWIFVILVSLAGIFIIIGAMTLLMSAGDPSKVTSGRQYILYAAIGLIVGFLARAVPAIVKLIVVGA